MMHVITAVLIVIACWFLLALAVTLVLGRWLHRSGKAPSGPVAYRESATTVMRGTGRLVRLPYVIESTARAQQRARRTRRPPVRSRMRNDHDIVAREECEDDAAIKRVRSSGTES